MIEWRKVRTYVVPEQLKDCKVQIFCNEALQGLTDALSQLTPFVTKRLKPTKGRFEGESKGGLSGEGYLKRWKEENGID